MQNSDVFVAPGDFTDGQETRGAPKPLKKQPAHKLDGKEKIIFGDLADIKDDSQWERRMAAKGPFQFRWLNLALSDKQLTLAGGQKLQDALHFLRIVIRTNADKLPLKYAVRADVPEHWEGVRDFINKTGTIPVWSGGSQHTIYEDAQVNYQFRAWHDYFHIILDEPFTKDGESKVAEAQIRTTRCITNGLGLNDDIKDLIDELIRCEITEQACGYFATGEFEDDQVAFTLKHLKWKGLV